MDLSVFKDRNECQIIKGDIVYYFYRSYGYAYKGQVVDLYITKSNKPKVIIECSNGVGGSWRSNRPPNFCIVYNENPSSEISKLKNKIETLNSLIDSLCKICERQKNTLESLVGKELEKIPLGYDPEDDRE